MAQQAHVAAGFASSEPAHAGSEPFSEFIARLASSPLTIPLAIVISLLAGFVLRTIWLGSVPPGLFNDEALFGYDAYSILITGRDHHGNFLPITIQGFNTYNMPLFCYSLVPLIGILGLKPAVVRLGIALWGCVDLGAMTVLAGLTVGPLGAAASALLGALSPWHLGHSRFAQEVMTAPATVDAAMVCFFLWLNRRRDRWLLLCGMLFGLSLYSYSITKAFVPLMIVLLAILYWREIRPAARSAAIAIAIVVAFAIPQVIVMYRHPETLGLVKRFSLVDEGGSLLQQVAQVVTGWTAYFRPSYLFTIGDCCDWPSLWRPPHFGMLLPEQAVLIVAGLIALGYTRYRKLVILLVGWLLLGTLPGALTTMPAHAARRAILSVAPWTLLSALGFVVLVDLMPRASTLKAGVVFLILGGTIFHGARFARAYFHKFPRVAAIRFRYGLQTVLQDVDRFEDPNEEVIMPPMPDGYIFVLFFEHYPPGRFLNSEVSELVDGQVRRCSVRDMVKTPPHPPVLSFDRYRFGNVEEAYKTMKHGVFVFPGYDREPAPASLSVRSLSRRPAYNILVK